MTTITLTPAEQLHLTAANRFLTRLTAAHHADCDCDLCHARWLTDVQDGPRDGWQIPGVLLEVEADAPGVVT